MSNIFLIILTKNHYYVDIYSVYHKKEKNI